MAAVRYYTVTALLIGFWCLAAADTYPFYLREAFSGRSWPKCSQAGEVCSTDLDCCDQRPCRPSYQLRGPKYACSSTSRSYRHLLDLLEAQMDIPSPKLSQGEKCSISEECADDMCCQTRYLFKVGEKTICDTKSKYVECL
ncbi:uncharacterized protein [Watersipora subatra]|uniref:uncharacterized protein n=1 Tax=Watersipora subatra TaxID=2589382 RepID=UPI00355C7E74